jgi:hypothetical protein
MDALFTRVIATEKGNIFSKFFSASGKVVSQKRSGEMLTITVETFPPVYDAPGKDGRYESFIFFRSILHYKKGYRDLLGKKINLTPDKLRWEFCKKSYQIASDGCSIKKIGH